MMKNLKEIPEIVTQLDAVEIYNKIPADPQSKTTSYEAKRVIEAVHAVVLFPSLIRRTKK